MSFHKRMMTVRIPPHPGGEEESGTAGNEPKTHAGFLRWRSERVATAMAAAEQQPQGSVSSSTSTETPLHGRGLSRQQWKRLPLNQVVDWTQTPSGEVYVRVKLPWGTRRSDVSVRVERAHMEVSLAWYGEVFARRPWDYVKASECTWSMDTEASEVTLALTKVDVHHAWLSCFHESYFDFPVRTHHQVLQEMVDDRADCDDVGSEHVGAEELALADEIRRYRRDVAQGVPQSDTGDLSVVLSGRTIC